MSISRRTGTPTPCATRSTRICGRIRSRCWRPSSVPARFRRALLGGAAALSLPHRQPPRRSRARPRPRLARAAPARCRGHARRRAAARRQARFHDLPRRRMPGEIAGEDARSARRVTRAGDEVSVSASARSFLHHQVRSMVGSLVLGRRGQVERATILPPRSPRATAPPAARSRRRRGCIWCGSITKPRSDHLNWRTRDAGLAPCQRCGGGVMQNCGVATRPCPTNSPCCLAPESRHGSGHRFAPPCATNRREQAQQRACLGADYSITSSARPSSAGGSVRAKVFAVFWLIRSSNLVA